MDLIVPCFVCVQRGEADASHIEALLGRLQHTGEQVGLTEAERQLILDFPKSDILNTNLISATDLQKNVLLERAATASDQLTHSELNLLQRRYWLDETFSEMTALSVLSESLDGPSNYRGGHCERLVSRLEQLRTPYYEINEYEALANAREEFLRRSRASIERHTEGDLQSALASTKCPPWAKQLLGEQGLNNFWGFVKFVDPAAGRDYDMECYEARANDHLDHATYSAGLEALGRKFSIDHLEWPKDDGTLGREGELDPTDIQRDASGKHDDGNDHDAGDDGNTSSIDLEDERLQEFDDNKLVRAEQDEDAKHGQDATTVHDSINTKIVEWVDDEDDHDLRVKFEMLRKHFRSIRERGEIDDGTLSNVFIVVDDACAHALFEADNADGVWVWAVDPDFDDSSAGKAKDETSQRQYRGFLRVRLQQLVDKFFETRKYHAEEYPMSALWQAAQRSSKRAFVSTKRKEQRRKIRRDPRIGSVLGPSQCK